MKSKNEEYKIMELLETITKSLSTASVAGIPLVFVVLGLVEYIKKLGVSGKPVFGVSMGLGILFGVGYQIATVGLPGNFAGWFGVVIYGLALGLIASGIYEAQKSAAK
jgi:hypothetical protein